MTDALTRENWREATRAKRLSIGAIAVMTGKSERAVRSYAEGTRRPADEWLVRLNQVIECIEGRAA